MRLNKVFGMLSGLSGTYRFSNAKLIHRESVLEHLGGVTLTCFLIYSDLAEVDADFTNKVDLEDVLAKAVCHDVEELLMGDIPRTTKYADAASIAAFKMIESQAMGKIFDALELESSALMLMHDKAKVDTSGLIVKVADVLAVVYKIHEEALERGNTSMVSRTTSVLGQLDACVAEIDDCDDIAASGKAFLADLMDQAKDMVKEADGMSGDSAIDEDQPFFP